MRTIGSLFNFCHAGVMFIAEAPYISPGEITKLFSLFLSCLWLFYEFGFSPNILWKKIVWLCFLPGIGVSMLPLGFWLPGRGKIRLFNPEYVPKHLVLWLDPIRSKLGRVNCSLSEMFSLEGVHPRCGFLDGNEGWGGCGGLQKDILGERERGSINLLSWFHMPGFQ